MDSNYPYLLVLNNDNIKIKLAQPLLHTQRIKYTCFDVSEQFLVFGATSGGLYVFKRTPCEFVQLMPYQEGVITNVCISPNEKLFAFTTLKGLVCILEYNGVSITNNTQVYHEHLGNVVTAIKWNFQSTELYVGDNTGKLSVVVFTDFIAKTMFQSPCFTIMNLDSQIVQIDIVSNVLLASTITRSYICDTMKEQYRQIGKKLREGEYGACFLNYNTEDVSSPVANDNYSHKKHIFSSVSSAENSFTSINSQQLKIFCARPGFRFWEVTIDGTVTKTHQFKQALSITPSKLITLDNLKDMHLCINNENDIIRPQSLQFSKLLVINNRFLLTFLSTSLYIFDPERSSLILWSNSFNDIMDICVINNNLYIWQKKGGIDVVLFVELENFILHCYLNKKYSLCAELCIENMDYLISYFPKSTKLHLLSGLGDKLKENAFDNLYEKIIPFVTQVKNYSEMRSSAQKSKNGIFIIDNAHFTESQLSNINFSENKDNSVFSTEAVGTFKEISNTVTDKLFNSTKSLKEKWQVFEEKFKTLGTDTLQPHLDSKNEQYKTTNEISEIMAQDNLPIVVPLETQIPTLLITEECEKIDPDLITLYEYYKLSKISKVSNCSAINNIIMKYNTISDFFEFLKCLTNYMNENSLENDTQMWCYNLFLQFLNLQNTEKSISIVLADSELKQYFLNGFVKINHSKEHSCDCNFPLPSASKKNVTYEKVGRRMIRLLWEINSVETVEICGKVPYMWRYIALLKKDVLNLLIQYNDMHLLESHLSNLFDVKITDVIDMYIELKHDRCLNCKKQNADSSLSLISWSSFSTMLINRFGNVQTVDALLEYSELIQPGELDNMFYQLCIVSSAFTKRETDFKQKFFDLKNSVLADENSAIKLEQMVENILVRRNESNKNNCRNPFPYK